MPHEYIPPSEIDGSPAEVAAAAKAQLVEVTRETGAMIFNAYATKLLDAEPSLDPGTINERWRESDEAAGIKRVQILIERL